MSIKAKNGPRTGRLVSPWAVLSLVVILLIPAVPFTVQKADAYWRGDYISIRNTPLYDVTFADGGHNETVHIYFITKKAMVYQGVMAWKQVEGTDRYLIDQQEVAQLEGEPTGFLAFDSDGDTYDEIFASTIYKSGGTTRGRIYIMDWSSGGWTSQAFFDTAGGGFSGGTWVKDMVASEANLVGTKDLFSLVADGSGGVDVYRHYMTGSTWNYARIYDGTVDMTCIASGATDGARQALFIGTGDNRVLGMDKWGGSWTTSVIAQGTGTGYWARVADIATGNTDTDNRDEVLVLFNDESLVELDYGSSTYTKVVAAPLNDSPHYTKIETGDSDKNGVTEAFLGASDGTVWNYYRAFNGTGNWADIRINTATQVGAINGMEMREWDNEPSYRELYAAGEAGWVFKFEYDISAPEPPIVWSPTHEEKKWSNNPYVTVCWKMPLTSLDELVGFSFDWTVGPGSPDKVIDVPNSVNCTTSGKLPEGIDNYFNIWTKDRADNWNGVPAHYGPLFIDYTPPTIFTVSMNTTDGFVNTSTVSIYVKALDGLSQTEAVQFSNNGQDWGEWRNVSNVSYDYMGSWDLTFPTGKVVDGSHKVFVRAKDRAGNVADPKVIEFSVDMVGPTALSVVINGGATYTNRTMVDLAMTYIDPDPGSGVKNMAFSNNGKLWSEWVPAATTYSGWGLLTGAGGEDEDGNKMVYFRVQDKAGNIGDPVVDKIFLDRQAPTGVSLIINDGAVVSSTLDLVVRVRAEDPYPDSGMDAMSFREDEDGQWTPWEPFAGEKGLKVRSPASTVEKRIYVQVRDKAGNIAQPAFDSIILDPTAPIISNVKVLGITDSTAVVTWDTDGPTTGFVEYGETTAYGTTVAYSDYFSFHSVTLKALRQDTEYHFQITALDNIGNRPTVSGDHVFKTTKLTDTREPHISDLRVDGITDTIAIISWKTDEPAHSMVDFGTTSSYGSTINELENNTVHSIILTGLTQDTGYYFRVRSWDPAGNGPATEKGTFVTLLGPDTKKPSIMDVKVETVTDSSALITWLTDEMTDTLVRYGTTATYSDMASDNMFVRHHSVLVSCLDPATTYHFRVEATDPSGNGPVPSDDHVFTTHTLPDTTPPVISNLKISGISRKVAVVSWDTDEPADSTVVYRTLHLDDNNSVLDVAFTSSHSIVIKGLEMETTYMARACSRDVSGNGPSCSAEVPFTTTTEGDDSWPILSDVRADAVYDRSAIIMWSTDEAADGRVKFGLTGDELGFETDEEGIGTAHSAVLRGLEPSTVYYFMVQSEDPSGNGPSESDVLSFTTLNDQDILPPNIADVLITDINQTSARLRFNTSEPGKVLIEFGTSIGYGRAIRDNKFFTGHDLDLTGLSANTTYHLRITVWDVSGNEGMTEDRSFVTLGEGGIIITPPPDDNDDGGGTSGTAAFPWWAVAAALLAFLAIIGAVLYYRSKVVKGPRRVGSGPTIGGLNEAKASTFVATIMPGPDDEAECPHCSGKLKVTRARAPATRLAEDGEVERMDEGKPPLIPMQMAMPDEEDLQVFEDVEEGGEGHAEGQEEMVTFEDVNEPAAARPGPGPAPRVPKRRVPLVPAHRTQVARSKPARVPIKTVTCGGCGGKVPVYTRDRPHRIKCPSCGRGGTLRK